MNERPALSDRGFKHMPKVPSRSGGHVRVYESSLATESCIWLRAECPVNLNEPDGPTVEVVVELTLDNAERLAEQIRYLCEHHYHHGTQPPGDTLIAYPHWPTSLD